MKFYEKLRHLGPEEVGQIVTEVMAKCPGAFKQTDDENAQLVVDKLDQSTFKLLCNLVDSLIEQAQDRVMKKVKVE